MCRFGLHFIGLYLWVVATIRSRLNNRLQCKFFCLKMQDFSSTLLRSRWYFVLHYLLTQDYENGIFIPVNQSPRRTVIFNEQSCIKNTCLKPEIFARYVAFLKIIANFITMYCWCQFLLNSGHHYHLTNYCYLILTGKQQQPYWKQLQI